MTPPPPRSCLWRQHLSVASSIGWQQMMRRWDVIVDAVDESLSGAIWKHASVKLSIIKTSARDTNISGFMLIRRDWWLCAMHETKSIKWSENIIYRMDKQVGHSEGRRNKNMRQKGDVLSNNYTRLIQCRSVGATAEGSEVKTCAGAESCSKYDSNFSVEIPFLDCRPGPFLVGLIQVFSYPGRASTESGKWTLSLVSRNLTKEMK